MKNKIIAIFACMLIITSIFFSANAKNIEKESIDKNILIEPMSNSGDAVLYQPWFEHDDWADGGVENDVYYTARADSDIYLGDFWLFVSADSTKEGGSGWTMARYSHAVDYLPKPGLHDFTFTYYYDMWRVSDIRLSLHSEGVTLQKVWVHFEIEHWNTGGEVHRDYSDVILLDEIYDSTGYHNDVFKYIVQETIKDVEIYPDDDNCKIRAEVWAACNMSYTSTSYVKAILSMWGELQIITISDEDPSPSPPHITGPSTGKKMVLYYYNISSTDPDGDNLYYYIDWGDGSNTGWFGPFSSGEVATRDHIWATSGNYYVRGKASDENSESPWGQLHVAIPFKDSANLNSPFIKILQLLQNSFPLLQHLFKILNLLN